MPGATAGLVLAGGSSRRFGSDKRLALIGGRPLLERAIEAVAAVSDEVVVAVSGQAPWPREVARPAAVRVVTDRPGDAGPLAGLVAGLDVCGPAEAVVVLAVDHPWATSTTLVTLRDALRADPQADAAVLEVEGRPQPLVAAYRPRVAAVIRRRLDAGDRRATALLRDLHVVTIADAPGAARTARDVDVRADLDAGAPRRSTSTGGSPRES